MAAMIETIPNAILAKYTVSNDFLYPTLLAVIATSRIAGVSPGTDPIAVAFPVSKAPSSWIASVWFKPDVTAAGITYAGRFLDTSFVSYVIELISV